jgi:hypothetical protein
MFREPRTTMGFTITDTVSCRLLPSQIAQLRELAAAEGVSLSRFVSTLCMGAIGGRESDEAPTLSSDGHGSLTTRNDDLGTRAVAILDTKSQGGNSPSQRRKELPIADIL